MSDLGTSFSPLSQSNGYGQQRPSAPGQPSSQTPLQQAIQILQLRLPHFFGGGAPAPPSLLSGSPGLTNPLDPTDLLKRMLGIPGLTPPGQPTTGGAPSPLAPPMAQPSGTPPSGGGTTTPAFHYALPPTPPRTNPGMPGPDAGPPPLRPGYGGRPY